MSSLKLYGSTSGYVEIVPEATAGNNSVTLPNGSGTLVVGDSGGNLNISGIVTATSVVIGAGSTASPSLAPTGDSNTGIFFPAADTIAFSKGGSEAARIDSSGRLLVGTNTHTVSSSQRCEIQGMTVIQQNDDSVSPLYLKNTNADSGGEAYKPFLVMQDSNGNRAGLFLNENERLGISGQGSIVFLTGGTAPSTERMRITSGGFLKATNMGSYPDGVLDDYGHYFVHNRTSGPVLYVRAESSSYADFSEGALRVLVNRSTTNNSFNIAEFRNGNASGRCFIKDSGALQNSPNSYGGISDAKLKENITDAQSQWNDIKSIEVKNYNFINTPDQRQIGVIAQQVEQVSPGLVDQTRDFDEHGNDLGTVTKGVKYSILYMKAVKALQEAMERIETLEAEVAALKNP